MIDYHELGDLLYAIRNRTLIADVLIKEGKVTLIPTVLEDLAEDSQRLVETFCVVEEHSNS